ncbi:helicase-associated domain-containing protein [Desulfosporosinus sp. OT]|uniref:helicase-associated domain-containing protein n=1 Tax=Desulfosporosinus sp. OT TaxID=913865 RepID=UPI000223AE8D|nr:helicase-associated domain-containing protein [Desulfosporosinus sp. OT]EGW41066.1 hypothetical protein DOT_1011 [Desulfosporosinus sp. OT]
MKKPTVGSKQNSNQSQSSPSDQAKTPKWRPVFGQKYPSGFKPPTLEADASSDNKSTAKSSQDQISDRNQKPTTQSNAKSPAKTNDTPIKKLKPKAWPDYFAKMDPTERIFFAYVAFTQPKDESIEHFYGYNHASFRNLDTDLPGLSYQQVVRLLSKWSKIGFFVVGRYANTYSFKEEAGKAFWKFVDKQVNLDFLEVEPEKSFRADLPGTLDNLFNFLVLVEQGEVLVTRTHEINKNSLKRMLAAMTEPAGADNHFNRESYFFWLLSNARFLQLFTLKGDRLVLTTPGREFPENVKVEDLICELCPAHVRSISNKGLFLVLPLLTRCTKWTSWSYMISKLISEDNVCNLLRQETVISLLDPMRFLGLLDWGKYENDILVRVTPLGQSLIAKLLQGQNVEDYTAEIKSLTDQVYPLSGPDTAYVQPNFEILLPRSAAWTSRWKLSQFAVLEQQDQMLKYRLDKTYLMNALKRGMPADDVLSVLKNLSTYPLPENLALTVQQWVESFGQVTFLELSLLECTSPEQAASIASSRKFQEYVLGLYSPTAVIVREVVKLRKLLEKQGIYPSPGILDGESVASRQMEKDMGNTPK